MRRQGGGAEWGRQWGIHVATKKSHLEENVCLNRRIIIKKKRGKHFSCVQYRFSEVSMASKALTMRAHLGIAAACLDPVRPTSSPNAIGGGRDAQCSVWSVVLLPPEIPLGSLLSVLGRLLSFHFQPAPGAVRKAERSGGEAVSRGRRTEGRRPSRCRPPQASLPRRTLLASPDQPS